MTSALAIGSRGTLSVVTLNDVGVQPNAGMAHGKFRLATDPAGSTTVTFDGVNAGSEIRVFLPDGTAHAGVESCDEDHALTWAYYQAGNANNTVTIRIVHSSYRIKEFEFTTAPVAAQSIPVQQELDKWYSNPA